MHDTHTHVFFGSLAAVSTVMIAPALAQVFVQPAFALGWNTAAACGSFISNGFAF